MLSSGGEGATAIHLLSHPLKPLQDLTKYLKYVQNQTFYTSRWPGLFSIWCG